MFAYDWIWANNNDTDPNFEQKLIDLGYDNVLDGSVNTASIDTVTILDLSNWNNSPNAIFDFTGIEDFISITYLNIANNGAGVASSAVSIDISQNTALTYLDCSSNLLTSLDVSQNIALEELICTGNQLTSLDVSGSYFGLFEM